MKMVARIRLVLEVPFEFDVNEPDESGHTDTRIEAAKHAETVLLDRVKEIYGDEVITDVLVEEVREA